MVNPRRDADNTADGSGRTSTSGTPRWVKAVGMLALAVIVLFVVLLFTRGPGGAGEHGPGRHQAPSSGVTQSHTPPVGGHG